MPPIPPVVINTALARIVDLTITLAASKMGKSAVVETIDQWAKEGNSLDQILDKAAALAKSTEDAAQDEINKLP